jgi:ribosomal-protein-alanine N-acetyltransferase
MLKINLKPFPILESERLSFRKLTDLDAPEVFKLRSNSELMKYVPRPLLKSEDEALAMIHFMNTKLDENTAINWGVTIKGTDKIIGFFGFYRVQPENYRTEIGYMLLSEHQGRGYATEAVKTMLNYAFNHLNFNSVDAVIDPDNVGSEKVLQKSGFRKEAHFKEDEYFEGKFWDSVHYGILKREFKVQESLTG